MAYEIILSQELGINSRQVATTIGLLDEGATVPFIARYRKEMTGSLDEVQIMTIRDRIQQLRDLDKRREAIVKSITEQGKLLRNWRSRFRKQRRWPFWKISISRSNLSVKPVH